MKTNPLVIKVAVLLFSVAVLLMGAPTSGDGQSAVDSAQAGHSRQLPKEGHERYEDPPAALLLRATAVSPAMVSQAGPFTSHQVNVDPSGNNIVGDAANEPSIAVDPTNPNRIAIGWRQFDTIASNFRRPGWGYTSNSGSSWIFPGSLGSNVFGSDPVLASDETGHFFYLNLFASSTDQFTDMWRSLDGGQSWLHLARATGGDKEWFTIDTTNSVGHGFQYQYFSPYAGSLYGARQFTRSTDGGLTWMDPILIPNSPQWGTLDVDTNGNLFLGGVNTTTNQVWCIRSTSAKRRTGKVTFDLSTAVNLGGDISYRSAINPGGFAGQIGLAVDRSGSSSNNNIYLLASLQPTGSPAGSGTDVMFVRSTDGGVSFSPPRRINDDPVDHAKWHWFGALSVAPNGRLDSVWLDSRNAANNTDSQLFYSYSADGGNTWAPNVAVSNSFDPFVGYPNQNKIGDYLSIVSDNAGANVAYAATFNGEQDIYYVRVVPTPVPNYSLSITPPSLSVPRAGGTVNYTVTIAPTGGFVSPVTLAVSGLPTGAVANFSSNPATDSSTLNISVGSSTAAGTYPFTVSGTGGVPSVARTATGTLTKARK